MMSTKELEEIYNNFINGNLKDMTKNINEYGLYDVFTDLFKYLDNHCNNRYDIFVEIVLAYHKIQYR